VAESRPLQPLAVSPDQAVALLSKSRHTFDLYIKPTFPTLRQPISATPIIALIAVSAALAVAGFTSFCRRNLALRTDANLSCDRPRAPVLPPFRPCAS
jgi:hypothetical protein